MGIFLDLYERLVRRFLKQKTGSRQTSLKRTQSLPREHRERGATLVVRPRSNTTEVTIERRRVSSRADWNRINKSIEKPETQVERKREKSGGKTESTTTKAIVITRAAEGKKSIASPVHGSILAPSYRNRTTSLRQHNNVITISI